MPALSFAPIMTPADPAAEEFKYPVSIDVRDLVTLDDVMEEMQLGPNGCGRAVALLSGICTVDCCTTLGPNHQIYTAGDCCTAWSTWRTTWRSGWGRSWRWAVRVAVAACWDARDRM